MGENLMNQINQRQVKKLAKAITFKQRTKTMDTLKTKDETKTNDISLDSLSIPNYRDEFLNDPRFDTDLDDYFWDDAPAELEV